MNTGVLGSWVLEPHRYLCNDGLGPHTIHLKCFDDQSLHHLDGARIQSLLRQMEEYAKERMFCQCFVAHLNQLLNVVAHLSVGCWGSLNALHMLEFLIQPLRGWPVSQILPTACHRILRASERERDAESPRVNPHCTLCCLLSLWKAERVTWCRKGHGVAAWIDKLRPHRPQS